MPRRPLRPLRSARLFLRRRPPPPHRRDEDKEIFSGLEGRSPDDAGHWNESAFTSESSPDMLRRKESAAAYPSLRIEQQCFHPQTPPWNVVLTEDGRRRLLFPST